MGDPAVGCFKIGLAGRGRTGFSRATKSTAMAIRKNLAGTECELVVDGRVDGPAAHELEIEVLALAKTDATTVYVNLAGANFLCSAAIRVLLQHRRQWKAKGKKFVVSRTSPEVDEILELTGMRDLIVESA